MTEELKPCPFCGEVPDLPSGDGTQYEIECGNCAMAMASVQICDLMTGEERSAEKFTNHRYSEQYVERAKAEAIKQWNTRATLSPAHIEDGEEVEVVGTLIIGEQGWDNAIELNPGPVMALADAHPKSAMHLMTVAQHQRIVATRSCPCQTDTARETRRKDGIEAAELQGILMRDYEACRPRDAGLMGWAAAALSSPPATDPWTPSGADYDRNIHHNPDAKAWADLFVATFPGLADKRGLMIGWFANAMMAMHDWLKSKEEAAPPASEQQRAVVMPEITGTAIVEVVKGVEGPSLYIGDENSGYRLAGPKPWGGGKTIHKFTVKLDELVREAMDLAKGEGV